MNDEFIKQIEEKFRVPERVADKLQIKAEKRMSGYVIYEFRPRWDNPIEWMKFDVAKLVKKKTGRWDLYWKRASGKWEIYRKNNLFNSVLNIIEQDEYGCFWG